MSNQPFRMTCETPAKDGGKNVSTLIASPELPQATVQFNDEPTRSLNVLAVSPTELRIETSRSQYFLDMVVIDRQSGDYRSISKSISSGETLSDDPGNPDETRTFETL